MIELLARAAIVAVLAAIAGAAAAALLARWVPALRAVPPAHRTIALEAGLALPWIVPALVVAAALAPSLVALVWPSFDHCGVHDDVHDHLCLFHPPDGAPARGWTAIAALVALPIALKMIRTARALARAHAEVAAIRRAARAAGDGTLRVESDLPLCAVVGLTRPVILVSDGARARVSAAHLAMMLEHERAHVARRDVLRHALARLAAAAHFPAAAAALLDELAIAREQACDDAAARAVGDRLGLAEAIVHAARVFGAHRALPEVIVAAFGPVAIESRVSALLADPLPLPRLALASSTALGAVVLVALPFVHHAVETLLGALLR